MSKIRVKSTSFEINKLITTTQLFSKVDLTISARLVLRCIVDYWNFNLGCAYPTQLTISKCTGLTEVAVGKAVKELDNKGLLEKKKIHKRIYYYLALKLLGLLGLTPKIIYVKDYSNKKDNIGYSSTVDENNKQDNSSNEEPKKLTSEELAKLLVNKLSKHKAFEKKVQELKEKYQP